MSTPLQRPAVPVLRTRNTGIRAYITPYRIAITSNIQKKNEKALYPTSEIDIYSFVGFRQLRVNRVSRVREAPVAHERFIRA